MRYATSLFVVWAFCFTAAPLSAADIEGTVARVDGDQAAVRVADVSAIAVGDRVEFSVDVPEVGQARIARGAVTQVRQGEVLVAIERSTGRISAGHRATIFSNRPKPSPDASADPAPPDDRPAFAFRGVVPGRTSRADLVASDRWGTPVETSRTEAGEVLRYRLRGYPDARALMRGGRVETIDVTFAEGVREEVAARTFGLGDPLPGPLPAAARSGPIETAEDWTGRRYSAGRVVLFVEPSDGQSRARLMRIHSASAPVAGSFVSIESGDTEIRLRGQDDRSRQVVKYVVAFLEKRNYGARPLDDALAAEWLKRYLATLDPGKFFLLREDVERFRKMVPTLDDRAREGDIGFAYDAFETAVKRRAQAIERVAELLAAEHDFTVDESLEVTRSDTPWPENEIESREILRKRVKYELLARKLQGASDDEAVERVRRHYATLFQLPKQVDDETLLEWTLTALGAARGTAVYNSATSYENAQIAIRNRMVGIGASLRIVDGEVVVQAVVPGSPSHADGRLAPGDVIVAVGDDDAGPSTPLAGLRLADAVALIRGTEGTTVRLSVRPKDETEQNVVRLRRASFPLASIRSITLELPNEKDRKFGWIVANSFYLDAASNSSSERDVAGMLAEFRKQGVEAVVLDLRTCTGGPLSQAIDLFGLFADGAALNVKDAAGNVNSYRTGSQSAAVRGIEWHGPLVVLTSTHSSSGAAILAAAVQDYGRGIVVGDSHTFPDTLMQSYLEIGPQLVTTGKPPNLGVLKYTQAIIHRPNGESLQGRGVAADIELPSFTEAPLGDAADIDAGSVKPATFPRLGLATGAQLDRLARASESRRRASPRFAEFERQVREAQRRRERRFYPLNEAELRTEQALDIDNELPDLTRTDFIRHGPYVDEVLAIAADYVESIPWLDDYLRGWRELRESNPSAAQSSFGRAIAAAGDAAAPRLGRAQAHAAANDWERAIADLRKAKGEGIRSKAAASERLRIESKDVAEVQPGDRLFVTKWNGTWLWARLESDRSKAGWIKASSVRVE